MDRSSHNKSIVTPILGCSSPSRLGEPSQLSLSMSVGLIFVNRIRRVLTHGRTLSAFSANPTLESVAALRTAKFPYGGSLFRSIMSEGGFFVDKTLYIKVLEDSGKYVKIHRPQGFGKTHLCDMISEFYDIANSAEEVITAKLSEFMHFILKLAPILRSTRRVNSPLSKIRLVSRSCPATRFTLSWMTAMPS